MGRHGKHGHHKHHGRHHDHFHQHGVPPFFAPENFVPESFGFGKPFPFGPPRAFEETSEDEGPFSGPAPSHPPPSHPPPPAAAAAAEAQAQEANSELNQQTLMDINDKLSMINSTLLELKEDMLSAQAGEAETNPYSADYGFRAYGMPYGPGLRSAGLSSRSKGLKAAFMAAIPDAQRRAAIRDELGLHMINDIYSTVLALEDDPVSALAISLNRKMPETGAAATMYPSGGLYL